MTRDFSAAVVVVVIVVGTVAVSIIVLPSLDPLTAIHSRITTIISIITHLRKRS